MKVGSSKVAHRCTCLVFVDGLGTPTGKVLSDKKCPQHPAAVRVEER